MPLFDASSNNRTNPGSSLTQAHTCSGSNRYLVVEVVADPSTDVITGVTYAGAAMTLLAKGRPGAGGRWTYAYGLTAPATGANNIVVSSSASTYIELNAASYTGVSQTGQPEVTGSVGGSASGTSYSDSLTTLTNNAWVVMTALGQSGTLTAGASTTLRTSNLVGAIFDSGGPVTPAGARSLAFTQAGSNLIGGILISLAPAATPSDLSGTVTLDDVVASGTVSSVASSGNLSGSVTLDDTVASGSIASSPSGLSGTVTLDDVSASGSFGATSATVVSQPFKNKQTGALMASATFAHASLLRVSDRNPSAGVGSPSTASDGRMTIVSNGLVAGVDYMLVVWNADGSQAGVQKVTAA